MSSSSLAVVVRRFGSSARAQAAALGRRGLACKALALVLTAIGLAASPASAQVQLSATDKHPSLVLTPDGLSASYQGPGPVHALVRSDRAVQPGSGMFYYEASRTGSTGNYGVGVVSATAPLDQAAGANDQGIGITTFGDVVYDDEIIEDFAATNNHYGFVVDYRRAHPIVYVIAEGAVGGPAVAQRAIEMTNVNGPVHIALYLNSTTVGSPIAINGGNDLVASPFFLDPVVALDALAYRRSAGLTARWTPLPVIATPDATKTVLAGSPVTLLATATDVDAVDRTASLQWTDLTEAASGSGGSFTFSPTTLGRHQIRAEVVDAGLAARRSFTVDVISHAALDTDLDGLSYAAELPLGTDPGEADSDDDGLADGAEVNVHGTSPTLADSDGDGIPDGVEIAAGIDPLVDDAALDRDGDTHSNGAEYAAGTDIDDAGDYPGRKRVVLNAADAGAGIALSAGGLQVGFPSGSVAGVRSDVAVAPGSGWRYFEATRLAAAGSFGIGVATDAASLAAAGGSDVESVGLGTLGSLRHAGADVATFANPGDVSTYGIAVDYSGATPIVHVLLARPDGSRELLPAVAMTATTTPLRIFAYGQAPDSAARLRINAGESPATAPFAIPAAYELFLAGFPGAEFLGTGWGPAHAYAGRPEVPLAPRVHWVVDENTDPGITLSEDLLGASYSTLQKNAMRANQGMIGQFRYWESRRVVPAEQLASLGQGFITAEARIDPYCCVSNNLVPRVAPPSMGVNSANNSVGRNLVFQDSYGEETAHWGFAVDYRGARPIVYVIANDDLVSTLVLDDVFTPIFPMFYGDPFAPTLGHEANFGERAFTLDPVAVLQGAGVSAAGLELGWGVHTDPTTPAILVPSPTATAIIDLPITLTATATGPNGQDLTQNIVWSASNGAQALGGSLTFTPTTLDPVTVNLSAFEAVTGQTLTASILVTVINDPGPVDSDGDGLLDSQEILFGSNPNDPDSDDDGANDLAEFNAGTNPNAVDSDLDGMRDGFEIQYGLDPLVDDAALDLDGDGYTNFAEFEAGTDPSSNLSRPPYGTFLNPNDRLASTTLTANKLGALYGNNQPAAVRSDRTVGPGQGFFYFETHLDVDPATPGANFWTSIEPQGTPLAQNSGVVQGSLGIHVGGGINYQSTYGGSFPNPTTTRDYGMAIDYRGASPIVHVIIDGQRIDVYPLNTTDPLLIKLSGARGGAPALVHTLNAGNDLAVRPFAYDPRAILGALGVPGASGITLGFQPPEPAPALAIVPSSLTIVEDTLASFTATATSTNGLDITHLISWSASTGDLGSGGSFQFTPANPGTVVVTATVVDGLGFGRQRTVNVTVLGPNDSDGDGLTDIQEFQFGSDPNDPDSDDDGANDLAEFNAGTNPNDADSDDDGMPDGFEIQYTLNPLANDAGLDPDGDGYTNLEEFEAGTNPRSFASQPPYGTFLNPDDRLASTTLTANKLGAVYGNNQPAAVRSDRHLAAGSGFYYFESHLLADPSIPGSNLQTSVEPESTVLSNIAGAAPGSIGVYVNGNIFREGDLVGTFPSPTTERDYGMAIDYRGASPIVHVIIGGQRVGVWALTTTAPLKIKLSGRKQGAQVEQQRINTGNDLQAAPFAYDPRAILGALGVPGADQIVLGFQPVPEPGLAAMLAAGAAALAAAGRRRSGSRRR